MQWNVLGGHPIFCGFFPGIFPLTYYFRSYIFESSQSKFLSLVTGQTVGEILRDTTVADEEIIRPVQRALATGSSIVIVRGSLSPDTAIIKLAVVDDRPLF